MNTHTKTVIVILGVVLGIICAEYSLYASEVAVMMIMLGLVQGGVYIMERTHGRHLEKVNAVKSVHFFSFPLFVSLFSFGVFLGIFRSELLQQKTTYTCILCTIDGHVISSPEIKNEYQVFDVSVNNDGGDVYAIRVKATLYPKYRVGDTIRLTGKISEPKVTYSHETGSSTSKSFDYVSYLHVEDVGSEMYYPKIELLDTEAHNMFTLLQRLKVGYVVRIENYISSPASSLAVGTLFGLSSMSQELIKTFRVAGLSHIVVLSGFNIVILISAILFILRFTPLFFRVFAAVFSVITFVIMVGASPSVIRATVMALISLLALGAGRTYVARQALVISLFLILMYEPYSLTHDVSLHLSFLAAAGLVYVGDVTELFLRKFNFLKSKNFFRELFAISLTAYISTLPYVVYTFGSVSVYALIANIVIVPLVPLVMLLSFLVLLCTYVSETLSSLLGFVDTCLIDLIISVARTVEHFSFSTISFSLTFTWMLFYYVLIIVAVKYAQVSQQDETPHRDSEGNLSAVISY